MKHKQNIDDNQDQNSSVRHEDFEKMIFLYQRELVDFIYKRTRDYHAAEDLCQETMIRAYRAMNTIESLARVKSWLYSIAYHVTIDWLRKQVNLKKKVASLRNGYVVEADPSVFSRIICQENERTKKKEIDRLWYVIRDLPPIYRKVVELRYKKWRSIAKIAKMTSIPESNVKVRLFRARRMLARAIERIGLDRIIS